MLVTGEEWGRGQGRGREEWMSGGGGGDATEQTSLGAMSEMNRQNAKFIRLI
jgi:hypothetical protein